MRQTKQLGRAFTETLQVESTTDVSDRSTPTDHKLPIMGYKVSQNTLSEFNYKSTQSSSDVSAKGSPPRA